MTMTSPPPYAIHVDGFSPDHFRVHALDGKETISEAYAFDVVVTADAEGEPVEQAALGRRAALVLHVGPEPRAFHGVVSAVRLVQVHHASRAIEYELRLVPRLWLLKRTQRTRIFQGVRVQDVVTAVLAEAGIATRWQLTRAYPVRAYCTQYEETDYRFIKRLLAEAGVYFYFAGGGPVDAAVLAAGAAVGAAAAVGGAVLGALGESAGAAIGSLASLIQAVVPGDTVVCSDDASCYPPVAGDDPASLAASTAAALAPAIGDGDVAAAVGAASAIAGSAIAAAVDAARGLPVLRFLGSDEAPGSRYDKLTRFSPRNSVRPSGAVYRDYDPDRPMVRLQSKAVSSAPFPPSPLEIAAMAAAAVSDAAGVAESVAAGAAGAIDAVNDALSSASALAGDVGAALGQTVPHEVYEHHGRFLFFPKWGAVLDEAPRILRQKRRRASVASGAGHCPDLSPGHRFTLRDHPSAHLDGDYAVTSVRHKGQARATAGRPFTVYENELECVPAELTYPPPRPKRKSVQVSLTATVVGPPGCEIHVDEKGQIKVQFHWDRDGRFDGESSCWIRVMQPWAGAAWGHQFIPRVGTEVVVVFEGGDPDKPMVLGSLYNGTHPPPFKLPDQKTKSGIRTQSTPGGAGSNELSFDDQAGAELVYLHAQRDLNETVERARSEYVGDSQTTRVVGSVEEHVGGSHRCEIGGTRIERIGGSDSARVGGSVDRTVGGALRATVAEETEVALDRGLSLKISGAHAVHVGGDSPTQSDYFVEGSHSLGASERIVVRADQGITLTCGKASITLLPDKLVLAAPTIELEAEESVECVSKKGPSLSVGDTIELLTKKFALFTEGGALEVDTDFKAKGAAIKLGYDPSKPSSETKDEEAETVSFAVQLSNYFLVPYKNRKYHVTAEGLRIEGETDGEGFVRCDLPAKARLAQIRLWLSDYPQGPRRDYTVKIGDMKPATSIEGAKTRLKNLGYYQGRIDDQKDDELASALAEFQDDHKDTHGLEATGEADDATLGALADVHGS